MVAFGLAVLVAVVLAEVLEVWRLWRTISRGICGGLIRLVHCSREVYGGGGYGGGIHSTVNFSSHGVYIPTVSSHVAFPQYAPYWIINHTDITDLLKINTHGNRYPIAMRCFLIFFLMSWRVSFSFSQLPLDHPQQLFRRFDTG